MEQGLTQGNYLNAYTFHITPYGLALLGAIFIGLSFALQLAIAKRTNRAANRFLGMALAAMVLWLLWVLGRDMGLETYFPHWSWLPLQFSLVPGPLIYFYVLKMTRPEYRFRWKDLLHFSPVLLEQVVLVLEIKESTGTGAATYQTPAFNQLYPILQLLAFISVSAYLYASHRLIERFYKGLKFTGGDRYRQELRWLNNLLTGFGLCWLLWIPFTVVDYFYYHYQLGIHVYYPLILLLAVMAIWIAAAAFLRPEVNVPHNPAPSLKRPPPAELKQKGIWLKKVVKANRYYQDPELSLSLLAEKLELTTHELSRIINTALKKSFNDFINEYRVAEVIKRMQDPAYDGITLLGIAYDSGFNSKSTFNLIFKKVTGKTPAAYKTDLKKEFLSYNLGRHPGFAPVISNHETTLKWSMEKLNRNFMFKNYLKIAWRNLVRSRVLSFIIIFGFSTGLAFVLLISFFIKSELSYDQFHKNKQNLYRITGAGTDDKSSVFKTGNTRAIIGPLFTPQISSIKSYCRVDGGTMLVKKNNDAISENITIADSSFFNMFSFSLISGNPETLLRAPDEAVVTDEAAIKIFGTADAVGKILEIEMDGNFIPFKITGIAKKAPYNSTIYFDVVIPFNNSASPKSVTDLASSFVNTFIMTSANAKIASIENSLTNSYNAYNKSSGNNSSFVSYKYSLQPLTGMHLDRDFNLNNGLHNGSSKKYSYILAGIAIFILVIACINFINIVLARSMQRAKEIGIRKVTGSTRQLLIFQFLSESLLITFVSVLPATFIIWLLVPYFSEFVKMDIQLPAMIDGTTVAIALGIIVLTGVLAGAYPALVLSSYKPVQALSGKIKFSGKNFLSKGLIVFQFVLAVFLIISMLGMRQQFTYLSGKDLGYKTDEVAIVALPHASYKKVLPVLNNELSHIPGVVQSTVTNWGWNRTKFRVDGVNTDWTYYQPVDEHFISFFNIKLLEGRNFYAATAADRQSCMINKSFARSMSWKNAIGKQIEYNGKLLTVTGVTADYNNASLKEEVQPIVLLKRDTASFGQVFLRYMPGSFTQVKLAVHNAFKKIDPWHNEEIMAMKDFNAEKYADEKSWATMVNFSAITCIVLSCLGLFGLSSLNIAGRIKEIAIRKILGAGVSNIVGLMAREFLKLVLIASVIAFPIGWWAINKWLQGFAYRISIHWWLFAGSALLAVIIALLTIGFQTIKAATTNPVKNLKTE